MPVWWKTFISDTPRVAEFRRWLFASLALLGGIFAGVHGVPEAVHGSENQNTLAAQVNELRAHVSTELYLARKRVQLTSVSRADTSNLFYEGYNTVKTEELLNSVSSSIERLYGKGVSDIFDKEVSAWVFDTVSHLELESEVKGKASLPLDDLNEIEKLCDNRIDWWEHYLSSRERRWYSHMSLSSRNSPERRAALQAGSPHALTIDPDGFFTWLRKQSCTCGFQEYLASKLNANK
jgi:hypothetical protein